MKIVTPKIIYKYRDWKSENHKKTLTNNELYLSSPSYFNDPFDCRIPEDFSCLDNLDEIKKYAKKFVFDNSDFLLSEGVDLEKEYYEVINDINNDCDNFQKNYIKRQFEIQDIYFGVLSMSIIWDSILMWSHYSDFHKGVCYGFNYDKLNKHKNFDKNGYVIYNKSDFYPRINPNYNITIKLFLETFFKSKEWEYEKEFRLTKLFENEPKDIDRKFIFDNDDLEEIILGINISEDNKNEIIEIARDKKIKIYQAIKNPKKFNVERILI